MTTIIWEYVFPFTFWASILRPGNFVEEEA